MSSSSNYLFLLFLPLVLLLLALLSLSTLVRGYDNRSINRALARAADVEGRASITLPAPMPSPQELSPPIMSETLVPPRNEHDRWKVLLRESENAVDQYLIPKIDMEFATFVRCVTFRVFAVVFLGADPDIFMPFQNLERVTAALSGFYDDRQGKSTLPLEVEKILYKWLPRNQFPNSVGHILPAYEALWRIIATLVVTCVDDGGRELRWVMLDFRDNPRDRQYRTSFEVGGRTVATITEGVVGRIALIARPPGHATTSNWPLSCMQYAFASNSRPEHPPTWDPEALKFAALLAAIVIGRIGVQHGISGGGSTVSQVTPWDQRKIFAINSSPAHSAINILELRPYPSRQEH